MQYFLIFTTGSERVGVPVAVPAGNLGACNQFIVKNYYYSSYFQFGVSKKRTLPVLSPHFHPQTRTSIPSKPLAAPQWWLREQL